ncbi:MAG: EAL domain-containing protein, partial [Hydrogenophilaceae bacterium]
HAFTEITGYTEAEVLGQNPRLLQSGRHDEAFYQGIWKSIEQTGAWSGEIMNRRKNGEVYPEWLTISSVKDNAGKLSNYVGVFADISQIKQFQDKLEHLAHYDPLTDLPNRLLLSARLDHAIERTGREHTLLALLFVDLDRFKTVNDGLGHPAGDRLLQAVAQRLARHIRAEDTFARLGGDEFVIVLEGVDDTGRVSVLAEKLLAALTHPFELDGQAIFIGASIGISTYPVDGTDAATLLKNADAAMYRSKEDGRNTYRFYNAEMTRSARERLTLETSLRQAIELNEFVLHYQPQVDVASGEMIGVEALVRWDHPESGMIAPIRFIPLAEETGLIVPLGEWVLFTACTQAKIWMEDMAMPPFSVAVNLSPRQFRQANLVAHIRAVIDATGIPPGLLELEITEGAVMDDADQAVATLRALKELGIKISIDDFGTGYSSLAYLKRFPIDKLKIDQSFMRDIPQDQSDMAIAATIIAMSRNLHMKVLAEGVETAAQLDFLRSHGCDAYQGYICSRPLAAPALEQWLAQRQTAT